jgi:hypothetical protein
MGRRLRNAIDQATATGAAGQAAANDASELLNKIDALIGDYDEQGYLELAVEIPLDGPVARWFGKTKLNFSVKVKSPEGKIDVLPVE